jgi:hypothetical protein
VDFHAYDTPSISARSFFELDSERKYKALDSAEFRKRKNKKLKTLENLWRN